jgi:hypothetical protein
MQGRGQSAVLPVLSLNDSLLSANQSSPFLEILPCICMEWPYSDQLPILTCWLPAGIRRNRGIV